MRRAELDAFDREVARRLARSGDGSAEALRFMRDALGMLRCALAERLAVSVRAIEQWESGVVPAPPHAAHVVHQLVLLGPENVRATALLRDRQGPLRGLASCSRTAAPQPHRRRPRAVPSWRRRASWAGARRALHALPFRGSA
jgi:DNA-binding transcriptional regulator YiaG